MVGERIKEKEARRPVAHEAVKEPQPVAQEKDPALQFLGGKHIEKVDKRARK